MANPYRDDKSGKFTGAKELLPIQYSMIAELISGTNKTDACEKLGVSRTTLYHWLDNELFMAEYRKGCERLYKMALGRAMNKLDKMMDASDKRTALKAVESMLKLNSYLNTNVNVTENTTETIIVSIVKDVEDDENEE